MIQFHPISVDNVVDELIKPKLSDQNQNGF